MKIRGNINNQGGVVNFGNINGDISINQTPAPSDPKSEATSVRTQSQVDFEKYGCATLASVRSILAKLLRTDSELDRFCIDYFSDVQKTFSSGMDRTAKINQLLLLANRRTILFRLSEYDHEMFEQQKSAIAFEKDAEK